MSPNVLDFDQQTSCFAQPHRNKSYKVIMEIDSCHNIFLEVQPTDEENGYQS
jgi:hypothetical protein